MIIVLIQCCETNCWHLEPRKYLETGLFVVGGCCVPVYGLPNSATSTLTMGCVMVMPDIILLYNCINCRNARGCTF